MHIQQPHAAPVHVKSSGVQRQLAEDTCISSLRHISSLTLTRNQPSHSAEDTTIGRGGIPLSLLQWLQGTCEALLKAWAVAGAINLQLKQLVPGTSRSRL